MKSGLRGAIVLVAICAWFAISNHCVFAALATNSTPSRECPFRCAGNKDRLHRVSVSFQACEARKAVNWSAVLQNLARSCFGSGKELVSR